MQKEIVYIEPGKILPNLYQPRKTFDDSTLDELAQSINSYGIIQPLTVRKMSGESFELVAGERRLRAAKKLGLDKIPVIIVDITDKESAAIALLENLQREDLNFIEEAEAYYNLIRDHSYTQEYLAETIGKKQSTIANKMRLLKLPNDIRDTLLSNNLTERHARALLKLPSEDKQKEVLEKVVNNKLNVKATEEVIDRYLFALQKNDEQTKKKRIKAVFSSKIYINTIKQVLSKYGIEAQYSAVDLDDSIEVKIRIPKK